jgi:3-hydroxymyristoyl/3-hydroxydecanoyl-(acyl carrier protein) dehydratase
LTIPQIILDSSDGDNVCIDFAIDGNLPWFKGHFPGFPILPGVVQLDWAVRIASERFGFTTTPREVLKLKFKSVIIPPKEVKLTLSRISPVEVQFEFTSAQQQHSSGKLRYAGPDG